MPFGAGTPRYEEPGLWLGTENWRGEFCRAPHRPPRGTSPSPRVVFDRATFSVDYEMPIDISGRVRTRLDYAGGEFRTNNWRMEIEMPIGM